MLYPMQHRISWSSRAARRNATVQRAQQRPRQRQEPAGSYSAAQPNLLESGPTCRFLPQQRRRGAP
eukprot:11155002-Lingulodinium_polyedra.AAC.1